MQSLHIQLSSPGLEKQPVAGTKSKKEDVSAFSALLSEARELSVKKERAGDAPEKTTSSAEKKAVKTAASGKSQEEPSRNVQNNRKAVQEKEIPQEEVQAQDENEIKERTVAFLNMNEKPLSELKAEKPELKIQETISSGKLSGKESSTEFFTAENDTVIIDAAQLAYLKTGARKPSLDDLIDNAAEYVPDMSQDALLASAQNLSVEDPEAFLELAGQMAENSLASEVSENISQFLSDSESLEDGISDDENINLTSVESFSGKKKVFTVIDQRSTEEKIESLKEGSKPLKTEISRNSDNSVNMTLTLSQNAENDMLSLSDQSAGAEGSSFKALLTQQIQYNAPEFVKAGSMVLKDDGHGTINMILKPESLGNVKVSLEVSDKVITGNITVASKEAFEAFKDSIQNLKQAFENAGYDSAEFNLSFDSSRQNQGFAQSESGREQMMQLLSDRAYSSFVSAETEDIADRQVFYENDTSYRVDVVA